MSTEKYDEKIKIMTLGNSDVGKTSFILRFTKNSYRDIKLITLGIDLETKIIALNNKKYQIALFDTAGQERYKSISLNTVKNSDGIILMYDITNQKSYDSISEWMEKISENLESDIPIILIGNKCDLNEERIISKEEGKELSNKYQLSFFETSNKTGENVEEAILDLINKIIKTKKNDIVAQEKSIELNKNDFKEKEKCKCSKLKK